LRRLTAISVAALGVLAGCEPRGRAEAMVPASFDMNEVVPYRPLARDDFRGSAFLARPQPEEERVPSAVCTKIVVRPGDVSTRPEGGGYVATLDAPSFFAVMGRTCSWWSLPNEGLSDEHVLEHGQIHFAIAELEARRLNARTEDIVRQVHARGANPESVTQRAQAALRAVLERAEKASRDRSTVFDHQVARDRVRQRAWLHKVTAELEVTRAYARGPQALSSARAVAAPAPATSAPLAAPPSAPAAPVAAPSPEPPSPLSTSAPSTGSFPE
jgi:hypothetical protein